MYYFIMCGDRNWDNYDVINRVMEVLIDKHGVENLVLVEGGAWGADTQSAEVAYGHGVAFEEVLAAWTCLDDKCKQTVVGGKVYHRDVHGRMAGPLRNMRMVIEYPILLVNAFHNDIWASKGTKDMIRVASKHNIPYEIFTEKE